MKYLVARMGLHLRINSYLFILLIFLVACQQKENKIENYISANESFSLDGGNHISSSVNEKNPESISLTTHIIPLKKDSLKISWQIIKQDFPAAWEYSFCDNTSCYFELPKHNTLNAITKSNYKEDGALKLQVNTSGIKGAGSLVLLIQNEAQTKNDTLYFEAIY